MTDKSGGIIDEGTKNKDLEADFKAINGLGKGLNNYQQKDTFHVTKYVQ